MAGDILRWWLVLELLGLVGLPLSLWLFRRLPDHGVSLSKSFGLLLTGYGAWLLTSLGLGGFGFGLIVAVAALVAGGGVWACRRADLDIRAVLRAQRWWWALTEAIFIVTLLVSLAVRLHGPDWTTGIGHTETPMDFTFLNGILTSSAFPPQDPWLAGYPINYYYVGYVLIALLTRVSGLPSAVTFTLALPTIFALAGVSIAGLVWNATGLLPRLGAADEAVAETDDAAPTPAPRRVGLRLGCALFAVVLVLLMGNQMPPLMYLTGTPAVTALDGSELVSAVQQSLAGKPQITLSAPVNTDDFGTLTTIERKPGKQLGDFFWWPSRAVWDTRSTGEAAQRGYAITEFPMFSLALGDMHPHVLGLPVTLLALALALNLLASTTAPALLARGGRLELALTAIVIGSLYAINSWDLPTYFLLYAGALGLAFAWHAPQPPALALRRWAATVAVLGAACYLLWLPFYAGFTSLVGGKGFPLGMAPARTGLHAMLGMFALFLIPLVAVLVSNLGRGRATATFGIVQSASRANLPNLLLAWPIITLVAALAGLALGWQLFWLLPLALWALSEAYSTTDRTRSLVLLLLAMGALVVWGTDVVYIRDTFGNRMNTIFKFFYQVWMLWGVGAGVALWLLLRRPRPTTALWLAPFALLFIGGSFYGVLAPNWKSTQPTTLNGLAQVERDQPADTKAIAWVRANTPGDAVILEAPGGGYNTRNALVAMTTGRQTVVGWWGSHELQWRGGQPEVLKVLSERDREATTIYTALDAEEAQPLLDKYGVDYVYVSAREQELIAKNAAPPAALTKFAEFMEQVYNADGVTIYKRR